MTAVLRFFTLLALLCLALPARAQIGDVDAPQRARGVVPWVGSNQVPGVLVGPMSTAFSTSATGIGINAPNASFTGNFADFQVNGTRYASLQYAGSGVNTFAQLYLTANSSVNAAFENFIMFNLPNAGATYSLGASHFNTGITVNYSGTQGSSGTGSNLVGFGAGGVVVNTTSSPNGGYSFAPGDVASNSANTWINYGGSSGVVTIGTTQAAGSTPTNGSLLIQDFRASKTANYTVVAGDTNKQFDNTAASGSVTFTLPTPASGLRYGYCVEAAQTLEVLVANTSTQSIYIGSSQTTSNGNITSSTVSSCIELEAVSTTVWTALYSTGSWAVN